MPYILREGRLSTKPCPKAVWRHRQQGRGMRNYENIARHRRFRGHWPSCSGRCISNWCLRTTCLLAAICNNKAATGISLIVQRRGT